MSLDSSFKAIVNLTNGPDQIEHLKRLALIFDEIYYVYPQLYCIEDMSLIGPAGSFHVDDFFGNCVLHEILTLPDLQETLSIFEGAKIAKGISARDEELEQLRRQMALIDHTDPEFRKLSPDSPPGGLRFTVTDLSGPAAGKKRDLVAISPSVPISDSLILTNTLFLANKRSLYPIFLEPRHRREMEYRYNQYKQASVRLASAHPDLVSPVNFPTEFGELSFSIFNNVWSHGMMAKKSAQDVPKYRNNMAPARAKYIASLTELAGIAENNPWNQKTRDRVTKYLLKLEADLVTYRQEADIISNKMFDDLKVHATEGVLTGLSGFLGRGISDWVLVLAGALMAAKPIPQAVKTFLDYLRTRQEHKNSSIAYIAEFK